MGMPGDVPADFQTAAGDQIAAEEPLFPAAAFFDPQEAKVLSRAQGRGLLELRPFEQRLQISGELALVLTRPFAFIIVEAAELLDRADCAFVVAEHEAFPFDALVDVAGVD